MSQKLMVIGHLNPDTDTIASSIGLTELLQKEGREAQAFKKGNLNNESIWALKFSGLEANISELVEEQSENQEVFFVDFNEESQSPINKEAIKLRGLLDHHKFACNFKTEDPTMIRIEPVGSTSTLVLKMGKEKGIELAAPVKKLLLCGIISDTLNLTSPTTTEEERKWVEELKNELAVDIDELAEDLFEAKSDLSAFTPEEIVRLDWKNFDFDGLKVGIGVVETVKPESVKKIEADLRVALSKIKEAEGLDFAYLGIVDILANKTEMIILSEEERNAVMSSFSDLVIVGDNLVLRGVVSRKKQIAPILEAGIKEMKRENIK